MDDSDNRIEEVCGINEQLKDGLMIKKNNKNIPYDFDVFIHGIKIFQKNLSDNIKPIKTFVTTDTEYYHNDLIVKVVYGDEDELSAKFVYVVNEAIGKQYGYDLESLTKIAIKELTTKD